MNDDADPWTKYSELREIAAVMDYIVKRASETREILKREQSDEQINRRSA